jgi:hypothetical protein
MASGYQEAAIRQESVAGAEKIDGGTVGIGGLITGGFRWGQRIGWIPNERMRFVLVE